MLFGTSCTPSYGDANTHPPQDGRQVWTNEELSLFPVLIAGQPQGNCPGFESRVTQHCGSDTNVNRAVNTGKPLCKVTQQSTERERVKCFKQARPSPRGSEWKHNIRGQRLRNLQAEKIHARNHVGLHWTLAGKCTRGQQKSRQTGSERHFGAYLHKYSAQSLRKAVDRYSTASQFKMFLVRGRVQNLLFIVSLYLPAAKSGTQCHHNCVKLN